MTRTAGALRVALLAVALLAGLAGTTEAEEYRLRVVSLYEDAFVSQLRWNETRDGATGPGLDRLEARLDRGDFPAAALLYDRPLTALAATLAPAWAVAAVDAEVRRGGLLGNLWDEVRWEGTPGQRSVWVVAPSSRQPQELTRLALRGSGPLRHFVPYTVPRGQKPLDAVSLDLGILRGHERSGDLWEGHVAPVLDLRRGAGVVVAVNGDVYYPDQVRIVVDHAPGPMTYKVVLAWRKRPQDREAPRWDSLRMPQ